MRRRELLVRRTTMLRGFVFISILMASYSLLLVGCGWHLRGNYIFPASMEKLYLKGTARYSELGVAIHSALAGTNSHLVESPGQAMAILHILSDKSEQRVLATDSSGRASEYEVSYLLRYTLVDSKGVTLVSEQQIKATREYRYDSSNVLATGSEVGHLKKEMTRFGVQQMLYRISASLRSK